jgi:beta-lactamase superfamily II metal-dependent hydrolase
VETLIQFARTDYALTTDKGNPTLYSEYVDAVAYAESQGTQVYSALDCWNNANGGQKSYYLNDAQTISMNILYNYFYENKTSGGGGENEYSVCMLLSHGEDHFLFTGDLEKKGEEYLVQYNDLPQCTLFKGGHHGSYTATSDALLQTIQPEIVCVCCCCGSTEYTSNIENVFPAQAFVDRVAKYTDKVYVTTVVASNSQGYQSLNGNIVVTKKDGEVTVNCSNNNTLFKDTDWFKANRTMPNEWKGE